MSDARSLADVCFPDAERFGVAQSFAKRHRFLVPDKLTAPLAFTLVKDFRVSTAERLRETEEFLYAKIPLTRAMQVRVESYNDNELVLIAPLTANHNHLGTAFGGSLAALVMLAGYSLLWLELGDRNAHIVISESNLRFRRPVRGTLRAICRQPNDSAITEFKSNFAAKGTARIQLKVEIEAEHELAVIFDGTYVAKK